VISRKSVLGVVPARGGSKGFPRKNIALLAGKPLIAWTIEAARQSKYIDRLVLSSDDQEIADVAAGAGCEVPFLRPTALARDDTPGVDPILHVLETLPGFDYVVVLQPTSPLRLAADIDRCLEICIEREAPSCVSMVEAKPAEWLFRLGEGGRLEALSRSSRPVARRQDAEPFCALNGAVYVSEVGQLRRTRMLVSDATVGYMMPPARSADVDTALDLMWCEFLIAHQPPELRAGRS
jgi:CMP-N,N'-diacetyllegionaminic acid synthase